LAAAFFPGAKVYFPYCFLGREMLLSFFYSTSLLMVFGALMERFEGIPLFALRGSLLTEKRWKIFRIKGMCKESRLYSALTWGRC